LLNFLWFGGSCGNSLNHMVNVLLNHVHACNYPDRCAFFGVFNWCSASDG